MSVRCTGRVGRKPTTTVRGGIMVCPLCRYRHSDAWEIPSSTDCHGCGAELWLEYVSARVRKVRQGMRPPQVDVAKYQRLTLDGFRAYLERHGWTTEAGFQECGCQGMWARPDKFPAHCFSLEACQSLLFLCDMVARVAQVEGIAVEAVYADVLALSRKHLRPPLDVLSCPS